MTAAGGKCVMGAESEVWGQKSEEGAEETFIYGCAGAGSFSR